MSTTNKWHQLVQLLNKPNRLCEPLMADRMSVPKNKTQNAIKKQCCPCCHVMFFAKMKWFCIAHSFLSILMCAGFNAVITVPVLFCCDELALAVVHHFKWRTL